MAIADVLHLLTRKEVAPHIDSHTFMHEILKTQHHFLCNMLGRSDTYYLDRRIARKRMGRRHWRNRGAAAAPVPSHDARSRCPTVATSRMAFSPPSAFSTGAIVLGNLRVSGVNRISFVGFSDVTVVSESIRRLYSNKSVRRKVLRPPISAPPSTRCLWLWIFLHFHHRIGR